MHLLVLHCFALGAEFNPLLCVQQPFLRLIMSRSPILRFSVVKSLQLSPGPRHEVLVPAVAPVPVCAILELVRGLKFSQVHCLGLLGEMWLRFRLNGPRMTQIIHFQHGKPSYILTSLGIHRDPKLLASVGDQR